MSEIPEIQGFPRFFTQPKSIYINLLMWVPMWAYPGSIMFIPTQNAKKDGYYGLE
ncbi:hypothetical protein [Proteus vulgaris]|uniref:hypothetical protein n=1 Tax=Proteus vulgaris TaxID=585 RepID=UPI00159ED89F|nr:hypothetical protein [Proteus vulgaris]